MITPKISRSVRTRGWRVARALWSEFGELTLVKRKGGFLQQSHEIDSFFNGQGTFVPVKEKLPCSLLFSSHKWKKRENPGWVNGKQELVPGKIMKLINILLFFSLAPFTAWPHLFCYLPFLLPPIASSLVLSVLSVDSGNLKPVQDQELVIHCANSHKSIYILIAFQE